MQTSFRESNLKQHCVIEWSRDDRSRLNNKANRLRRHLSLEIDTCIDASLRSNIAMNWCTCNLKQRINLFTKKYTVSPHLQSILSFLVFFSVLCINTMVGCPVCSNINDLPLSGFGENPWEEICYSFLGC